MLQVQYDKNGAKAILKNLTISPNFSFYFIGRAFKGRWTYVVALVMGGQELFTESKNLFIVLRYNSSKLATTRTILWTQLYLYKEFA